MHRVKKNIALTGFVLENPAGVISILEDDLGDSSTCSVCLKIIIFVCESRFSSNKV